MALLATTVLPVAAANHGGEHPPVDTPRTPCDDAKNPDCASVVCATAAKATYDKELSRRTNGALPLYGNGCGEMACRAVSTRAVDRETYELLGEDATAKDCLEFICRTVPAVFEVVRTPGVPIVTLLGTVIPQVDVLRRVLVSAAVKCEDHTGGGGNPRECRTVLDTPVASAGAEPYAQQQGGYALGNECAWAETEAGGRNYVHTRDNEFARPLQEQCSVVGTTYMGFGGTSDRWTLYESC